MTTSTEITETVPVAKAAKPGHCQHAAHGIAVIVPAPYRETAVGRRFLCEAHALPAICDYGVGGTE